MNDDGAIELGIDLYSLHLLRQVAKFRSFTAASEACGLSQSALTRQVQAIEARLGIKMFERTTRSVTITEPGAVLLRETEAIPNILSGALRRIREEYLEARREIRIGLSPDLSLSHIPGIFHSQRKLQPEVGIIVSQSTEAELLQQIGNAELDLGILTEPRETPSAIQITHRMADRFVIAVPGDEEDAPASSPARLRKWMASRRWLLPPRASRSRELIDEWSARQKVELEPAMELENFDLMVHLVSMGMGTAFIPRRCLGGFRRKRLVKTLQLPSELERELIVIAPRHARSPEHVTRFVEGILFS